MNIYWIDLFCGAGGTSTGIHISGENVKVIACVNHDWNAIQSHLANHPDTMHFTEDIRDFTVVEKLKALVDEIRINEPNAVINLWASLECTNHSRAKGGLSRDADSRSLAHHMNMYLETIKPDYFFVENVVEFLEWGPIIIKHSLDTKQKVCHLATDKKGKYVMIPDSMQKGAYYNPWVASIEALGYAYDHEILNSANYGAWQARKRLFIQFARNGNPITWPRLTHNKTGSDGKLKHKAVKLVLDLDDEGKSIFERKIPLVENTLKRILAGMIKFVPVGENCFTKRYNGGDNNIKHMSNSIEKPMGTLLTNNTHALVFVSNYKSGHAKSKNQSIDKPIGTVSTIPTQSLVHVSHLNTYYGNGGLHSVDGPAPTITTKDRISKIDVSFIDQQFSQSNPISIEQPINALTTVPKFSLLKAKRFLYNPQYNSKGGSVENPCFTLIARMDKQPPGIVTVKPGIVEIAVTAADSATMKAIKQFMVDHKIIDIKMRMLNLKELLRIQGFPEDYILRGTQAEQKKYIGNAVEVNMAKALIAENTYNISQHKTRRETA